MDKNRYFQIRSGKYTKTKVADIQRLCSKWLWLVVAVYKPLLVMQSITNTVYQMFIKTWYKYGLSVFFLTIENHKKK